MMRELRRQCGALLQAPCFLKRDDSGKALLVSDYPRRNANECASALKALADIGYHAFIENSLLYIDLSAEGYARLAASLPLSPVPVTLSPEARSLCLRLSRTSVPPECQPVAPIRMALLFLDRDDLPGLCSALLPVLAVLLREHVPMPSCIAGLIISYAESARF